MEKSDVAGINEDDTDGESGSYVRRDDYLCSSSKTYEIDGVNSTIPLRATMFSFAPSLFIAELMLTNVMMLSVLIAIFTYVLHTHLFNGRGGHLGDTSRKSRLDGAGRHR